MTKNPIAVIIVSIILIVSIFSFDLSKIIGGLFVIGIICKCINGYEDNNRRNSWWK